MPPDPITKIDAQRRADQIAAFRAELEQLTRDGVMPLAAEQLAAIRAHHDQLLGTLARRFDVDRTEAARRMSLGMQVASTLGAAALVAAVVSFFYRIWGTFGEAAQIVLLTAAPLAATCIMLLAARIEKTRYVASIFASVACAAVVLQTVLLGQMFNMRSSPHAVGVWALFALVIAVPWRFGIPFAWGIVALVCYIAARMLELAGVSWTMFPERPETLMAGALVVIAASGRVPAELRPWARSIGAILVLGAILVMSEAGGATLLPLGRESARVVYQLVAVVAAIVTIGAGLRRGWDEVLAIGCLFAGLFMLTRFVDWWWDWMPKYLFFLILASVAIGWLWALRFARTRLARDVA